VAVKASVLAGAVGVSSVGIVGVVRPFALDLPLRTILKGHRRNVESPSALIAIFLTRGVVPSTVTGIGAGFRQFMSADVGQSRQTLRLACNGRLRVATGVAIQLPKEGELNRSRSARAVAVVGTIAGVAPRNVCVDGILTIRGWAGNYFTDLRQDGRCLGTAACG
jgi:hypothetical protein